MPSFTQRHDIGTFESLLRESIQDELNKLGHTSKVKTLSKMTKQTISQLEKLYGCKIQYKAKEKVKEKK